MASKNDEKTTTTTTTATLPDKEQRKVLIQQELDVILKGANNYVQEYLEEDEFEQEAIEAITKAANELAYRKKYYNVMNDKMILFPSVTKLIMKNMLQEEAEKYYWEEDDEFPLEYSKCLKTVVKEQGLYKDDDDDENNCNDDNDAYMEKLAQDVEI